MSDPRVVAGLRAQLEDWRAALEAGAGRVGWKIGLNVPEVQAALGIEEPVIGHLTSDSMVESGGRYHPEPDAKLKAEPEVSLEMGRDVDPDADADAARDAIAGVSVALELVDTSRPPDGIEAIVATNVFHRAVAFGVTRPALPAEGLNAALLVGGEERETAEVPDDLTEAVLVTARLLGEAGERLQRGDRIIAGSLTPQVDLAPGDDVTVEIEGLGRVELRISP
jgi:2-keto-4-pentenoate hydratase